MVCACVCMRKRERKTETGRQICVCIHTHMSCVQSYVDKCQRTSWGRQLLASTMCDLGNGIQNSGCKAWNHGCLSSFVCIFFLFIEIRFFSHIVYPDYGCLSLYFSQFISTSPPIWIHYLSVTLWKPNRLLWGNTNKIKQNKN